MRLKVGDVVSYGDGELHWLGRGRVKAGCGETWTIEEIKCSLRQRSLKPTDLCSPAALDCGICEAFCIAEQLLGDGTIK